MTDLVWAEIASWLAHSADWRWLAGAAITLQGIFLLGAALTRRRGAQKLNARLDVAQTHLRDVKVVLDAQPTIPPDIREKGKISKELEDAVKNAMAPFVADLTKKLERAEQEVIAARREAKAAGRRADIWALLGIILGLIGLALGVWSLR